MFSGIYNSIYKQWFLNQNPGFHQFFKNDKSRKTSPICSWVYGYVVCILTTSLNLSSPKHQWPQWSYPTTSFCLYPNFRATDIFKHSMRNHFFLCCPQNHFHQDPLSLYLWNSQRIPSALTLQPFNLGIPWGFFIIFTIYPLEVISSPPMD